jgi:ABC-type Fe3+-hydroxamate transport system substrate-binding protein
MKHRLFRAICIMPDFTDQTGRTITLHKTPQRIISLVPSQTELLYDLGLTHEVAGITKFCVHPEEWFRNKVRIGGTKQLKPDIIHQTKPDLIIANKEENVREQVEELSQHYPVWISDVSNLADAYEMIGQIGILTGKELTANQLISSIQSGFAGLQGIDISFPAAYLIWQHPYMTIGGDTFIHSMMTVAGFHNIFYNKARYPEILIDELRNFDCRVLLLPSEPFPFKQKHAAELRSILPGIKICLVDGEMFSWYGSRLQYAPGYFLKLHKEIKSGLLH